MDEYIILLNCNHNIKLLLIRGGYKFLANFFTELVFRSEENQQIDRCRLFVSALTLVDVVGG